MATDLPRYDSGALYFTGVVRANLPPKVPYRLQKCSVYRLENRSRQHPSYDDLRNGTVSTFYNRAQVRSA